MPQLNYPILRAEIARPKKFQHPPLTSKPETLTQSAQTYIYTLYQYIYITVSASFGGFSTGFLCELIDWSLNDLDALIEVYNSYPIYLLLFTLFIYLFALCYIYFCLLTLLVLLFAVVDVVVVYSFLTSFYCCCSGFSMYFTFL